MLCPQADANQLTCAGHGACRLSSGVCDCYGGYSGLRYNVVLCWSCNRFSGDVILPLLISCEQCDTGFTPLPDGRCVLLPSGTCHDGLFNGVEVNTMEQCIA